MIDRNHALPNTREAELVGISRGNVYYLARAASEAGRPVPCLRVSLASQ